MKMLLQPGDKVAIRSDIKENTGYKMKIGKGDNVYTPKMGAPGDIITIDGYRHGQYYALEDDFWNYTDEMFDPDLIEFLYQEYLDNKFINRIFK